MIVSLLISLGFSFTIWDRLESPMVAGHRGGTQSDSYNTIERFEEAIEEDVDILEMDLRLSQDGVVVVFHDEDLDKKTNCQGLVAKRTWEYIKNCTYKSTNHKVPSFQQVVDKVSTRAIINAEFKTLPVIKPTLTIVKTMNIYDWAYFQVNAEMDKYREARGIDNDVALLYKPTNERELKWLETINDPMIIVAHMDKKFVTAERIARVHALGKFVSVNSWKWDVFEERFSSTCKKLYDMGIDFAVANNTIDCVRVRNSIRP